IKMSWWRTRSFAPLRMTISCVDDDRRGFCESVVILDTCAARGLAPEACMEQHLKVFRDIVGEAYVLTDKESLAAYGRDWTKLLEPNPSAVVLPKTTEQVSKVLAYCHKEKIPVVPSGGRTGLAGGAIAANGEVVLSLSRMTAMKPVDTIGLTLTAEAG